MTVVELIDLLTKSPADKTLWVEHLDDNTTLNIVGIQEYFIDEDGIYIQVR